MGVASPQSTFDYMAGVLATHRASSKPMQSHSVAPKAPSCILVPSLQRGLCTARQVQNRTKGRVLSGFFSLLIFSNTPHLSPSSSPPMNNPAICIIEGCTQVARLVETRGQLPGCPICFSFVCLEHMDQHPCKEVSVRDLSIGQCLYAQMTEWVDVLRDRVSETSVSGC